MIKPTVLMLDEPTAGVSPIVMDELFDHIIKVKKENVSYFNGRTKCKTSTKHI